MSRLADPRDRKQKTNLPVNPYPAPAERLEDREGYPFNNVHSAKGPSVVDAFLMEVGRATS